MKFLKKLRWFDIFMMFSIFFCLGVAPAEKILYTLYKTQSTIWSIETDLRAQVNTGLIVLLFYIICKQERKFKELKKELNKKHSLGISNLQE